MKKSLKLLIAIFCVALSLCLISVSFAYDKTDASEFSGTISPTTVFKRVAYMFNEQIYSHWECIWDINRFKWKDNTGQVRYSYSLTLPWDDCDTYDGTSNNQGYVVVDAKGNYYLQEIENRTYPRLKQCYPITLVVKMFYTSGGSTRDKKEDSDSTKYLLLKTFECGENGNCRVVYTKDGSSWQKKLILDNVESKDGKNVQFKVDTTNGMVWYEGKTTVHYGSEGAPANLKRHYEKRICIHYNRR